MMHAPIHHGADGYKSVLLEGGGVGEAANGFGDLRLGNEVYVT